MGVRIKGYSYGENKGIVMGLIRGGIVGFFW